MRHPISIIHDVGLESQTSIKKAILFENRSNLALKRIMVYATDPHKKYHIKALPDGVKGVGTATLGQATWLLLDKLVNRELTGNAAKKELVEYAKTLTHNDCVILRRVIRKKMQIGVSAKTVNAVWPDSVPPRGLQKGEDWDPQRFVPGSLASLKLDGFRGEFKAGNFFSYGGHIINGLDHLVNEINYHNPFAHLDGEIIIPGISFDAMSGILRSKEGNKERATFAIFDNLQISAVLQQSRCDILAGQYPSYLGREGNIGYLSHMVVNTLDEVELLFRQVTDVGHEGLMIKQADQVYFGDRSYRWMKRKKGFSGEYICVNVYEGEDGMKGTLGGAICMINGVKVRVGSGFTKKERAEYWHDPSKIIGKPCTLNAFEKTKAGSLRHPSFKNVRWDLF